MSKTKWHSWTEKEVGKGRTEHDRRLKEEAKGKEWNKKKTIEREWDRTAIYVSLNLMLFLQLDFLFSLQQNLIFSLNKENLSTLQAGY